MVHKPEITLKELRKRARITQVELATKAQLSISTIAWLEQKKTRPSLITMRKLEIALGPELAKQLSFVNWEDDPPKKQTETTEIETTKPADWGSMTPEEIRKTVDEFETEIENLRTKIAVFKRRLAS